MSDTEQEFTFEYEYTPNRDAEERMTQAWEIILALMLEDYMSEAQSLEANSCSTQSASNSRLTQPKNN